MKKRNRASRAAAAHGRAAGASTTTSRASSPAPTTPAAKKPPPTAPDGLTPKQARFVAEYLIDLNATGAARRAGYSAKSAESQGHQNLEHPLIATLVAAATQRALETAGVSQARLLEELGRVALANVRDYFDPVTHDARHPSALTEAQGAALAGFEVLIKNAKAGDGITDTIHKFKLWDKVRAIELYMRYYQMLVEKVEVNVSTATARVARLNAARKRTS